MKDRQAARRDAITDAIRNAHIANRLNDYCDWYASHIIAFGELMPEYGPEYLEEIYLGQVEDGETPERAFNSVVCIALERDF